MKTAMERSLKTLIKTEGRAFRNEQVQPIIVKAIKESLTQTVNKMNILPFDKKVSIILPCEFKIVATITSSLHRVDPIDAVQILLSAARYGK